MIVALLQQGVGQRLNAALHRTSLGTGGDGRCHGWGGHSLLLVLHRPGSGRGCCKRASAFGVCFTFLIASPVINEGVLLVLMRQYSMMEASVFLLVAFGVSVAFGLDCVDRLGMAAYCPKLSRSTSPGKRCSPHRWRCGHGAFQDPFAFCGAGQLQRTSGCFPLSAGRPVGRRRDLWLRASRRPSWTWAKAFLRCG